MAADKGNADAPPVPHDCLECRLIGTGAMVTFSGYFAYLAHVAPVASTNRRFGIVCSIGFACAGIARWCA